MFARKCRLISISTLVFFLCGCATNPKEKYDRTLAHARDLLAKKDYARAILECKTAVQVLPNEAIGYYELGLAYISSHQLQNAIYCFKKAIQLKPSYPEAQVQLAGIMATTENPGVLKQAEDQMTQVVKAEPDNSDALDTLALTELKLGKADTAVGELGHALTVTPQSLRSSVLLAEAKNSRGDFAGAEETLEKACQKDPKSSDALINLAAFHVTRKKYSEAEQELTQAVRIDPTSGNALLALGKLEFYLGQKQAAEMTARQLSRLPDRTFVLAYGKYLLREGKRDEAIREFEQTAKAAPHDREARSYLVAAYWSDGRTKDAKQLLDKSLADNANDADALSQRAQIALNEGDYRRAETDLQSVSHLNANSWRVHYLLAKAYEGQENSLRARQELGESLRLSVEALPARLEMAALLIQSDAAPSALKLLEETPAGQKDALGVLVARNWALMSSDGLDAARKGIDEGLSIHPQSPDLRLQDALWKLRKGKVAEGRASLDAILVDRAENLAALHALYESYAAQDQGRAGAEKVAQYAARFPRSAAVQVFLGRVLMANGQDDSARAAFSASLALSHGLREAREGIVQLDIKQSRLDAAVAELTGFLADNPKDSPARLALANVEEMKGDHGSALASYEQVAQEDPRNAQALNNVAYLLADFRKQPDAALPYAQKAQELEPKNPDYTDTVGWVLYQKGLYTLALKNFEEAADNPAAAPVCRYHLAMAYAKLGQMDRGRAVLESALKRKPGLPEAAEAAHLLGH